MENVQIKKENFKMNEYLEVNIKPYLVQLCSDCYNALGWSIFNTGSGIDSVTLKMKRDRKVKNRVALCDLQRKCENAFQTIEKLENAKTNRAVAISLGVGIVGTAFIVGSVFAYLAGMIFFCVILAILGLVGWILPYFLYQRWKKKSEERIKPLIDSNYDIIYEACEKAYNLLN